MPFSHVINCTIQVENTQNSYTFGYIFGLLLLIFVVFFGTGAKGAQRWLDVFGIFTFQPSELMKIVVPLTVAAYLSEELLPPQIKITSISFLITLIPCFLIFIQPDLGTSILIASSGFFVIWLAGVGWYFLMTMLAS